MCSTHAIVVFCSNLKSFKHVHVRCVVWFVSMQHCVVICLLLNNRELSCDCVRAFTVYVKQVGEKYQHSQLSCISSMPLSNISFNFINEIKLFNKL